MEMQVAKASSSAGTIKNRVVCGEDARPAGREGECFYCNQPIGHPHGVECVVPSKRVRIRAVIEYERDVPANWDPEMIEFSLNESSSCADNELERMSEFSEQSGCLCDTAEFTYLGPANDEAASPVTP